MPRFEWLPDYETGDAEIDRQHRQLLTLANLLFDAVAEGRDDAILKQAFDALLLYTHQHFEDEERFFAAIGSTQLERHRDEHKQLADEVRDLWMEDAVGFVDGMGRSLETWVELRLVPHMMEEDPAALKAAS